MSNLSEYKISDVVRYFGLWYAWFNYYFKLILIICIILQVLSERFRRAAAQRTLLLERLERARDMNDDLKFRVRWFMIYIIFYWDS